MLDRWKALEEITPEDRDRHPLRRRRAHPRRSHPPRLRRRTLRSWIAAARRQQLDLAELRGRIAASTPLPRSLQAGLDSLLRFYETNRRATAEVPFVALLEILIDKQRNATDFLIV